MEEKKSQEINLAGDGSQQILELLSGFLSSPNFSRPSRPETLAESNRTAIPDPLNHVARYRTLVEQIPAIVFMAYLDDGIGEAYVSPHIEQVLGFSQEEWLDDPIMWFRQIHPDDKLRWSAEAANMFIAGEPLHSMYRVMARDGRVIWFHCEAKMVHREDGAPWFIHGVAIDITELKEAEADLRLAHDELEVRVIKRTAELTSANQHLEREILERKRVETERALLFEREKEARRQAEAANRIKDEFLATVSHELRNPLNVIMGYSSILLRIDGPEKWPQVRRAAEAIQRNALAQSQLVSDLLDMSRLQMGKLEINRQTLSVAPILKDAVDTVRLEAQAKNITLEMKLPVQPVYLYADSVRLRQVIWNLLNNAVKFTDRDGRVEIALEETADAEAKLTIADNGKGIDPQFLPHVFEMFRQGDASTTRNHGGMGIGLALVRQLVEIHNGRVEVHSAGKGRGASFTIFLPLHSEDQRKELIAKTAGQQLRNLNVLIVDDSVDTIEMLRKLLELEGAIPETAKTGSEALEILSQKKFDLLISDISMPEMDGFELLRRIRTELTITQLPAVALTGFGRAEDARRADDEGFAAHLTKPIDLDTLIETIHHVLVSCEPEA